MTKKLTPWFPGGVKPARVGVYLRRYSHFGLQYCYWDGELWSCGSDSIGQACANEGWHSEHKNLPWRGLAVKP